MSEYKNIEKIKPQTLLSLMREVLDLSKDFLYISGTQPFFMSFDNKSYYVYVKNISSAYFSDRDKTTRAQLPIKPEFDLIKSSPYPFIFLGYDGLHDVFVCWNYNIAKERLNVGKSVSFYSRTFFQSEVNEGEFVRRRLKNGDLPVLFKRTSLIEFFKRIDTFFSTDLTSQFHYSESIGNYSYEERFKTYLKLNKNLSDKSIDNYSNALKNRISEALKKYFIPSLETIYFISNISILEKLNMQLFEIEDLKQLNIVGKSMYSSAFNNYISFIKDLSDKRTLANKNKVSEVKKDYQKDGKLLKIGDINIIKELEPYIRSNQLLSAAQIVGKHYAHQYPKMELYDWITLVKNI